MGGGGERWGVGARGVWEVWGGGVGCVARNPLSG